MIKLLVIEDEVAIRDLIRFALPRDEFHMAEAESFDTAMHALADSLPDIILLDWMLPGKSGIDCLKKLRQQELTADIPIIMLTAKAEEEHKLRGLETGADDYVTKPFSPPELIMRIKTILRRGRLLNQDDSIQLDNLTINTNKQQVSIADDILELRPIEYKLLHFFITHPNKVYSREQLIQLVWGIDIYIDDRTVDVNIRRLRDKLKPYNYHQWIKTIRGSGYQFSHE